VGTAEGG